MDLVIGEYYKLAYICNYIKLFPLRYSANLDYSYTDHNSSSDGCLFLENNMIKNDKAPICLYLGETTVYCYNNVLTGFENCYIFLHKKEKYCIEKRLKRFMCFYHIVSL